MRAHSLLDIPLGAVATFVDDRHGGMRYVFVGWAHTNAGPEAVMVRELQPKERLQPGVPWTYHCAMADTLLQRFPELSRYARPREPMFPALDRLILAYMSTRCDVSSQHKLPGIEELQQSIMLTAFHSKKQIADTVDDMVKEGRLYKYGPYLSDRQIDVL